MRGLRAAPWVALLAALGACGGSPRMLHQSNVYYERCAAADFDPDRSFEDRQRCWEAWLEHYGEGQSPLRLEHAHARVAACEAGVGVDPLPDVALPAVAVLASTDPPATDAGTAEDVGDASLEDAAADGEAPDLEAGGAEVVASTVDTPEPDPPPRVRPRRQRPIRTGEAPEPCAAVCAPRWDRCVDRCGPTRHACVDACRGEYRICMGGCL